MERSGTIYCPEKILEVQNKNLMHLIIDDVKAKIRNPSFIVGNELVTFPITNMSLRQSCKYRDALIEWGCDPINPSYGIDGHGYGLMLTHILRHIFKDSKDIIVMPTPATLDFLDGKEALRQWGPSADIYIGQLVDHHIKPIFLIDAIVGSVNHETTMHRKLNVPIVCLPGNELFDKSKDMVFNFAIKPFPISYANHLAERFGPNILQRFP